MKSLKFWDILLKRLSVLILAQGILIGFSASIQAETFEEEIQRRKTEAETRKLEAETRKEEANATKAEADATKAAVAAEKSKFELPEIDTKLAPTGKIEFSKDEVNVFEGQVAADGSLENIVTRINDDLWASCISEVVIIDNAELQKLNSYEYFTATHALLNAAYKRATGGEQTGLQFLSVPGLVAESLAKTLAFFKKDVKFFPGKVDITKDDLVAQLVDDANDLPLDYSHCSEVEADASDDNSFNEETAEETPLTGLTGNSGADDSDADTDSGKRKLKIYNPSLFTLNSVNVNGNLSGQAKNGIIDPLTPLFNLRNANKDSKDPAIIALNEQTDALLKSLFTIENGRSLFSDLTDASRIIQLRDAGAKVMMVDIKAQTNTKTTNSIFGNSKKHSGGVRVEYQVIDEDDSVLLGDVKYDFSGYQKLDKATSDSE